LALEEVPGLQVTLDFYRERRDRGFKSRTFHFYRGIWSYE